MRTAVCTLALVVSACSVPATSSEEGHAAPRTVAPTPAAEPCEAVGERHVWARFAGPRCDWELRDDEDHDDGLVLVDLAVDGAPPAHGLAPAPCHGQHCVYSGVLTEAGPVLVVSVLSTDSEMPSDAYVGVPDGEALRFVDLWDGAGDFVRTDLTEVGPAHALAPHVCGDALGLLAVRRVDAGHGTEPPAALRAREGLIVFSDQGTLAPTPPSDRSACTPVTLANP